MNTTQNVKDDLATILTATTNEERCGPIDPADPLSEIWTKNREVLADNLASLPDTNPDLRALASVWDVHGTTLLDDGYLEDAQLVLRPPTHDAADWLRRFADAHIPGAAWHLTYDYDILERLAMCAADGEPTVALAAVQVIRNEGLDLEGAAVHRALHAGIAMPRIANLLGKPIEDVHRCRDCSPEPERQGE